MRTASGPRRPGTHLTDDEIDAYWRERLPESDIARVEEHYLECATCQARVRSVEDLIGELNARSAAVAHPTPAWRWPAIAASLAAIAVVSSWLWMRNASIDPGASAGAPASTVPSAEATPIRLAPPTRSEGRNTIALGSLPPTVVFEIDAREAGAPGSQFGVVLHDGRGATLLTVHQVVSNNAGLILVSVETAQLRTGALVFEISGSLTITVPLTVDN